MYGRAVILHSQRGFSSDTGACLLLPRAVLSHKCATSMEGWWLNELRPPELRQQLGEPLACSQGCDSAREGELCQCQGCRCAWPLLQSVFRPGEAMGGCLCLLQPTWEREGLLLPQGPWAGSAWLLLSPVSHPQGDAGLTHLPPHSLLLWQAPAAAERTIAR